MRQLLAALGLAVLGIACLLNGTSPTRIYMGLGLLAVACLFSWSGIVAVRKQPPTRQKR